jgi:hypothetical protein
MSHRQKILDAVRKRPEAGVTVAQADRMLDDLLADGWVILRAESVRRAQERQRIAEARLDCAERDRENAYVWARACRDEERHLRERLNHVYGVARAHGVTIDELKTPSPH